MLNKENQFRTVATNSFGTSTHETGSSVILTGNPFEDLAAHGINLHGCTIRHYRGTNGRGNSITGRFNINGREITAGATSYEALINNLVQILQEYRRYVKECHLRRRQRYRESWLSRHPEFTFYNCNVTFA